MDTTAVSIALLQRPLFGPYQATALNDDAAPVAAPLDLLESPAGGGNGRADVAYERAPAAWAPIDPLDEPDRPDLPVRFIDGSIASRLVGALVVDGRRRPLIAATIAAAALERRGRALTRASGAITRTVLAVYRDGIDPDVLAGAASALQAINVTLLLREMESGPRDFDTLRQSTRNRAMDAMEASERDVLLQASAMPTLVDGLLERRLVGVQDRALPVVGLVKQHAATYLPADLHEMLYTLAPGQRTPAFAMEVDNVPLVNVYVRLSALHGASPSYGVVRVAVPVEYLERYHAGAARWRFLSALAGYLHHLRHRDEGYGRAGISIEPVVRVEEHLTAIRPSLGAVVPRLHRLFRDINLAGAAR